MATWHPPVAALARVGGEDEAFALPSGRRVVDRIGAWPVIHDPSDSAGRLRSRIFSPSRVPPGFDSPEDLPARICEACATPLPETIAELDAFSVAVVGMAEVGKSTFIATFLREALERDGLSGIGCIEMSPTERTALSLQQGYLRPFFLDEELLSETRPVTPGRLVPLEFRVKLETSQGSASFALLLFDIAGESIADRSERFTHARHIFHANCVIFLMSPYGFPTLREKLDQEQTDAARSPTIRQVDLLSSIGADLQGSRMHRHISVVLSKADLLQDVYPREFAFLDETPRTRDGWKRSLRSAHDGMHSFYEECGARDILRVVDQLGQHSLHACSCIERSAGHTTRVARRVLDPLVAALEVGDFDASPA